MFTQIITNTPTWVWILLAGLIALGYSQSKDRVVSFKRLVILPIVMVLMSANSMAQTFGLVSVASLAWLVILAVAARRIAASALFATGSRYDEASDSIQVRGSWLPLFLILAIFIGKYLVAIVSHINPQLSSNSAFGVACAVYFGGLSAVFLGRAMTYLAMRRQNRVQAQHVAA